MANVRFLLATIVVLSVLIVLLILWNTGPIPKDNCSVLCDMTVQDHRMTNKYYGLTTDYFADTIAEQSGNNCSFFFKGHVPLGLLKGSYIVTALRGGGKTHLRLCLHNKTEEGTLVVELLRSQVDQFMTTWMATSGRTDLANWTSADLADLALQQVADVLLEASQLNTSFVSHDLRNIGSSVTDQDKVTLAYIISLFASTTHAQESFINRLFLRDHTWSIWDLIFYILAGIVCGLCLGVVFGLGLRASVIQVALLALALAICGAAVGANSLGSLKSTLWNQNSCPVQEPNHRGLMSFFC
jgi:hypothetical protein